MNNVHSDQPHHQSPSSLAFTPDRIFKIVISLNLVFVLVEVYFGITHHSLALVSDGVHNLTDVLGLSIAWLGYWLSKKHLTQKFSVYAAFINTSLLLLTSVWIIFAAYERYLSARQPVASTVIIVASIGFFVNFFSAKLFHKDHHHDLNMKAAYLHLMADAAISLGVVVTGIIMYYKSIFWIDPVVSAVIAIIIIFATWKFFKKSLLMLMGKATSNIGDKGS